MASSPRRRRWRRSVRGEGPGSRQRETAPAWSISPATCSTTTCSANVTGKQNVTTYVVGFGDDIAESADYLEDVATAGGGKSYTQSDAAGLTAALEEIFAEVAAEREFNLRVTHGRGQRLQPHAQPEYAIRVGVRAHQSRALAGQREEIPAHQWRHPRLPTPPPRRWTRSTGFFAGGTSDLFNNTGGGRWRGRDQGWRGGRLPAWDARKMYTYLGTNDDLTVDANKFRVANTLNITNEMIGVSTGDSGRRDGGSHPGRREAMPLARRGHRIHARPRRQRRQRQLTTSTETRTRHG